MKKELKGSKLTTARVRECMRLLITGLTVREIVQALGLSSRTVESYFENIKNKLNSWSKKDIYMFSIRLNEFLL
jgi:DNA-binding NarL/FixJ family response regulator